ncbi:hypothetical protein ACLKA6_017974 [Drosophila palustris]
MSIVLDVVQKIVLHGAYELTCSAAVEVFKRCQCLEESTSGKRDSSAEEDDQQCEPAAGVINIQLPDPPKEIIEPLKLAVKPVSKEPEVIRPVSLLDITTKNSGPICPPKSSCMRLARNSYFS